MSEAPLRVGGEDGPVDVLWEDGERVYRRIWRSTDEGGRREFLIAQPCAERPAPDTVSRLTHEYGLKDYLNHPWALHPLELVREHGLTMLVFESTTARPLDKMIGQGLPVGTFLRMAIAVAHSVACLHQCGLIHKDIKPTNVLIDRESGEARLAGFGIASRLPRERQRVEPPELIAGTLSHMAPEQTGRMNRSVDSRSDLYSLGITLYQALTGSLPFTAKEPMELVHCHIARTPLPPTAHREEIPQQVAAIVMKLLAKTPENRYHTAVGVELDLRRCLDDWEERHAIAVFSPGERDHSDRLLMPDKLYGREREIETLLAAFDSVLASAMPHLLLVSGYSGIGKSSVVNELYKTLVPRRGLFAAGKFDQLKRDVPYATLAQAFQSLIRQLLAKPEAELTEWGEHLRHALSPNGALLSDLIPELKFLIGEQPAVPEIPSSDAKARFQITIRRLIAVFARPEHPLALFLDDLQWLDGATLDLLEDILVQPEPQHLLLIGAYRDNEVDAAHPLMRKLAMIRESGAVVQDIVLCPLDRDALTEWVADAVHCQAEPAQPLAQLMHDKTGGNPFFAKQFLQELLEDDLIVFEPSDARWHWDLGAIRSKRYTDNVADFMVAKLGRLPAVTQEALKGLACLGSSAKASTLATVQGTPEEQLHSDLWEALRLELIVGSEDSYRFAHDRVQEAAYSLVSDEQRAHSHLRIGRLLTELTEPERRQEAVFEIVGHFNRAAALIPSEEERNQIAALNLMAGKRAKKAAAFGSALNYLIAGITLVPKDGWERRQDLSFELELHRAECEFLMGDMASAEEHLRMLSSHSADAVQSAEVTCLVADVHWALLRPERGLAECLAYVRDAGLDIPIHPAEEQAQAAYKQICSKLEGVGIDELAARPLMTDLTSRAVLDVLSKVLPSAATVDRNLVTLLVCAAVDISLERGHCESSCFAYGYLGFIACWTFGDFEAGFRFGRLGQELVERKDLRKFEAFVRLMFAHSIGPWARHIASCLELDRIVFDVANQSGDRHPAAASCGNLVSHLLLAGEPLLEAEKAAEVGLEFCRKAAFGVYVEGLNILAAFIRNLRGLTRSFGSLDDERFNERRILNHFESQPHMVVCEYWYWSRRLQARFFAGDYAAALDASIRVQGLRSKVLGAIEEVEFEFCSALTHAAVCDSASPDERRLHLDAVAAHLRQLQVWARQCPENFENRAALAAAELARIEGRDRDATQLYEHAIRSARENGFVQLEALALELAAQFYAARGFDRITKAYLRDARDGYRQWGAEGKVRQLESRYPSLRDEDSRTDPKQTMLTSVEQLDLSTVLKVSQAVQGETDLEKLIAAVMRLGLEHAGADRGLLILPHVDGYQIEAEARSSNKGVSVDLRKADIGTGDLPQSVLQYVLRTRERVLLQDASTSKAFTDDEYLCGNDVRSVLCVPLLKQTRLTGIIYLENNLTAGAFTPDRMALLEVLASDAAISLENARLYRDLREREARVRRLIDANIIGISIWHADGRILDANEEFLRIVGYGREDLVSGRLHWNKLTPPEGRELDLRALKKVRAGEGQKPEERELLKKDGSRVPVLAGGATFEGVLDEGVGFMIDLTERKRDEAEIRALKERLYRENLALRDEVDRTSMFEEIVGDSKTLKAVLSRIAKVAPTDSTVLILGETGTGKELIARAVHKRSPRRGRAFVSVNCAALAPSLIASELFGHEKGAFTGATQRRLGRFELADGGTLFLDEVGELPPDVQVALLRVLQEREFERIGGGQPIRVDVRVIAATNRDLKAAIGNGTFRSDLFYRLDVFPIEVPPLRDRKDDILMLVEYFVQRYAARMAKDIHSVDKKTLHLLQSYDWPGNIRELANIIERSVILSSGDVLSVDEMWLRKQESVSAFRTEVSPAIKVEGGRSERETIEATLAETRGRVSGPSGAAAKLRIPSSTLESRIKTLKINKQQFKFGSDTAKPPTN